MSRRRKIPVNNYELATDAALARAAAKHKSRAYAKVRIADALDIYESGLTDEEYSYALKAHFDFVVEGAEGVDFAVEFDEPHHRLDSRAKQNDRLKNAICFKLDFPLVRIDAQYLRGVGQFATVLDWLVEMWYMEQGFISAQQQGKPPDDEDFYSFAVFEWGYIENKKFIPVDLDKLTPSAIEELSRQGKVITWRPYSVIANLRKASEVSDGR